MELAYPRMDVVMANQPKRKKSPGVLARILKRLRAEHGLTQKQIAARAVWADQGYYSRIESGEIQRPGDDKLRDLDRAFELEPDTLVYWLNHGPPWEIRETSPAYDAPEAWPRLSEIRRRQVNDFAAFLAEQDEQDTAS